MSRAREIRDFFIHLRPHYQLLILPAGYLLGALYQPAPNFPRFLLQFFSVSLLLNGGVTAYNSYYDKDEGPIGGLSKPPPLAPWTLPASLLLQIIGLVLAWPLGPDYLALWATTMVLSIFYSRPYPRWKGHPLLSLVAVGIGTGTNTFLLGYLAAGPNPLQPALILAAFGVAALLLSMYPVSQLYQVEADQKHGDRTFAMAYGARGVRRFFAVMYPLGLALVFGTLREVNPELSLVFGIVSAVGYLGIYLQLSKLKGEASEYRPVMRLKYFASLLFSAFVAVALIVVHG